MYISNASELKKIKTFRCNRIIGNYLIKKGIPLLSRDNNYMIFAYTNILKEAIDNMPFFLKIFLKGGTSNE